MEGDRYIFSFLCGWKCILVKKLHEVCVLSAFLCDMTLYCTAAHLFFADLLWSMNQQPESVFSKCLPKAKTTQERVLQVKVPKFVYLQVQN